jgi:hypothetical protein
LTCPVALQHFVDSPRNFRLAGAIVPYELEWQRVVALAAAACIVAVAIGVFAFRPRASANRRLALVLIAQATGLGAGWSLGMMARDPAHAAAWITLAWAAYAALLPLYLLFLATLATPLVRPLASKPATRILWSLAVVAPLIALLQPDWFFSGLRPRAGSPTFVQAAGPLGTLLPALHALPLPVFGLLAALHQWRRASTHSLVRRQAVAYAMAFGWRDLSWLVLLGALPAATGMSVTDSDLTPTLLYSLMELGFMTLVAYGILSTQLFDIDVKARVVIRQSTVAAAAGALFFLVSHLTEQIVDFEGALPALIWATIIALTFGQLQKLGRNVAARVLPVRTAPEDEARRVMLYEAALDSFSADGAITEREAAALARLRERLGLSASDVAPVGTAGRPTREGGQ